MAYRINKDECIACGTCQPECPVAFISEESDGQRLIDETACISCGNCVGVCPVDCILEV